MLPTGPRTSWVTVSITCLRSSRSSSFSRKDFSSNSFALRSFRISCLMKRKSAIHSKTQTIVAATYSLYEVMYASPIRSSLIRITSTTRLSSFAINPPNDLLSIPLSVLRLSMVSSTASTCSPCLATTDRPRRSNSPVPDTTCTDFFAPNNPARPLFFLFMVVTFTYCANGRCLANCLSALFLLSIASITLNKCFSFSASKLRSVSTCSGFIYPAHNGFTACNTLSAASLSLR